MSNQQRQDTKRPMKRSARYLAVVTLALAIGVPSVVAHTPPEAFSDVPHGPSEDGTFLHQAVNAMRDAGITAGCGNNNYCPDQNVTRGQMAIFLKRGLGSVDQRAPIGALPFSEGVTVLDATEVEMPGTQFVKVDAKVEIAVSGTTCDCDLTLFLTDGVVDSPGSFYQFNPSSVTTQTMTDSWVFQAAGGPQDFFLVVFATDNNSGTDVEFNSDWVRIISTTYPFDPEEDEVFGESTGRTSRIDRAEIREAIEKYKS